MAVVLLDLTLTAVGQDEHVVTVHTRAEIDGTAFIELQTGWTHSLTTRGTVSVRGTGRASRGGSSCAITAMY